MDKKEILKVMTKEWQSTNAIALKLHTGGQNVINSLYELFLDDKKIERQIISFGKRGFKVTLWKLK